MEAALRNLALAELEALVVVQMALQPHKIMAQRTPEAVAVQEAKTEEPQEQEVLEL